MKRRTLVDRLMPLGTRRHHLHELAASGIHTIRREGWHSFARRVRIWFRMRRMARTFRARLPQFRLVRSMAEAEGLVFPQPSREPQVSIVIPAYNHWDYTITCLKSISGNTEGDYEVIVVDDASTDETPQVLSRVKRLDIVTNRENMGFVESCNQGARAARGRYLLVLNNDTIVTENWLAPLLAAAARDDVGAVGPKLIYPDGTLQEAGGIIWNDGSGWNYGRGDDPGRPEYNYVREVDYCSGAALLVKRQAFDEVGGFDSGFKPGYYEDTDLCFSLRDRGYKVMYQPRSVVVHFEGVTCGTDVSSGVKRHQELNRPKFVAKWRDVLQACHYRAGLDGIPRARDRRPGKSILVIDHYVPTYDKDSGSLRMFNMLKILSELGHRVTFAGDDPVAAQAYTQELQQEGIEVVHSPYVRSVQRYVSEFGRRFDIVILSRGNIAKKYIDTVSQSCPEAKIVFDTVDLEFLREYRRAKVEGSERLLKQAQQLKASELRAAHRSALTVVVSRVEKEVLLEEDPCLNIEVVSNIHRVTRPRRSFSERRGILFIGGFDHPPNVDAVTFFVKQILPLVKVGLPDVRFYVAGSNPVREILHLRSDDVIVSGYVRDLTPYLESCKLSVAPMRYGAGVKGKINQSMSHGLPVVTTSIGAEGTEAIDGEDILIADLPVVFAQKVVLLYGDENLWRQLSENSIRNVQRYHSYEAATAKLGELLGECGRVPPTMA